MGLKGFCVTSLVKINYTHNFNISMISVMGESAFTSLFYCKVRSINQHCFLLRGIFSLNSHTYISTISIFCIATQSPAFIYLITLYIIESEVQKREQILCTREQKHALFFSQEHPIPLF